MVLLGFVGMAAGAVPGSLGAQGSIRQGRPQGPFVGASPALLLPRRPREAQRAARWILPR